MTVQARATRPRSLRWLAIAGALTLGPGLTLAVLSWSGGLPSGPDVAGPARSAHWVLPAVQTVHDLGAAVTVGLLVLAATVLPVAHGSPPALLGGVRRRAVRLAAAAGAVWVSAGAAVLLATAADAGGDSGGPGGELALATSLVLALGTAVGASLARRTTTAGILAVLGIGALLPLAVAGHESGTNHGAAVNTLAMHLVGVSVWVGGLVGMLALHRSLGDQLLTTVQRYSQLAGWCFALVAGSGVLAAVARLASWRDLASTYGAILLAKTAALLTLGVLGWWQRARVVRAAGHDPTARGRLFGRLATVEILVMGLAIGLAVALARTGAATPSPPAATAAEALLGAPLPPPLTPLRWVSEWRLDGLWAPVSLIAVTSYLLAVRRLRRRGDRWPAGRTAAWLVGSAGLLWATSSGPGVYGNVLFSMHMVQHMTVAMGVPVFLVLGAPVTLALRALSPRRDGSRGPREWLLTALHSRPLAVVAHPLVATGVFLGSLVFFYYSPFFEFALRSNVGHVLMTVHFLVTGYLFASVICGVDPGPARPPYLFRLILLVATMGFHAFFGVVLMGSRQVLAEDWFASLGRTWGRTLMQEQNLGGALAWGLGDYPVAIMAVAMAWAWVHADEREQRQYDARAERDGDAELAAYNAYLQHLSTGRRAWP